MRTIFARVLLTMSLAITTLFPQEIFGSSVEKRVLFPKGRGTMTFEASCSANSITMPMSLPLRKDAT